MSRIGNVPVSIATGVTVSQKEGAVEVRGPKGALLIVIPKQLIVEISPTEVLVKPHLESKITKSLHGLVRTQIANAVTGVTKGWEKKLELVGVGYRAIANGKQITLTIGFSHPVVYNADDSITFAVSDNTKVSISGIDKELVGETAARIRAVKPPEPYKGKGIRYVGEVVRKKAGKAVKAATGAA